MRYGISPFRFTQDDVIDMAEEEYSELVTAKGALVAMIGVEQKFDLLLENYADYERELLTLSLHQVLHRDLHWQGFQEDLAVVTRRLANLLSAARLYVDQIKHDLSSAFGPGHTVTGTISRKTSEQYDARLGYRVMETLRNIMQHRSLPVHQLSYPSNREETPSGPRHRIRTVPSLSVARLRDANLKASVVSELEAKGEYVPLTPLVREYIEGLGHVHEALREVAEPQITLWDSTLASVQTRAAARWGGGDERAFLAVQINDSGQLVASVQVFTELTKYRRTLEQKNSVLANLARRYVSSACEEDDA
jgi:hypothetical protein